MISASRAFAITPNDAPGNLHTIPNAPQLLNRLWVGGAGTVTVITGEGEVAEYTVTTPGYLYVTCIAVKATGTTATLMVGEYYGSEGN